MVDLASGSSPVTEVVKVEGDLGLPDGTRLLTCSMSSFQIEVGWRCKVDVGGDVSEIAVVGIAMSDMEMREAGVTGFIVELGGNQLPDLSGRALEFYKP